jgi:hypothetical protein
MAVKTTTGFLFNHEFPQGKIFSTPEGFAEALGNGWVQSPDAINVPGPAEPLAKQAKPKAKLPNLPLTKKRVGRPKRKAK